MQVFSWKQLQNAALEEVGARLIGKTHSWNFGRNRKYFANFRNILVILINIFLNLKTVINKDINCNALKSGGNKCKSIPK